MQNVIAFLKSKTFVVQLVLATLFFVLIFVFTYNWLGAYTKHGETVTVPNLKDMKLSQLENFLKDRNLSYKVADSSVFILDKPAGIVVEQDPLPNAHVKENRTIYVTITRTVPPKVHLPNLIDVSQRQAEAILGSYGLKAGTITYKADLAKNAVLEMSMNGKPLKPGDEIPKGSTIDFVLGDGIGNTEVSIPNLVGLSYDEALFVLKGSGLTQGMVMYDSNVRDSSNAIVYKQSPAQGESINLKQGESIDLYLK